MEWKYDGFQFSREFFLLLWKNYQMKTLCLGIWIHRAYECVVLKLIIVTSSKIKFYKISTHMLLFNDLISTSFIIVTECHYKVIKVRRVSSVIFHSTHLPCLSYHIQLSTFTVVECFRSEIIILSRRYKFHTLHDDIKINSTSILGWFNRFFNDTSGNFVAKNDLITI